MFWHVLKRSWRATPRGILWLAGGLAAAALIVAVAWVLFVPVADWLAHHDVGSATAPLLQTSRDAARGRLLTLSAGLFAAGALVFTARNFRLSREGQVTDRYTKAIEQLGSDKLDVRIGGIYALERVARYSAKDHPTVMEVLTAFVREHSREPWPSVAAGESGAGVPERTRPDVLAAAAVIGRRNARHDRQPIRLAGARLAGARLVGADLAGANLNDAGLLAAHLDGADLTRTNLSNAFLVNADLRGAKLHSTDLAGADLRGAHFGAWELADANLYRALVRADAALPEGWQRDTGTGRLKRTDGPATR